MNIIGQQLRQIRKAKQLTQTKVSQLADIPQNTVSRAEISDSIPPFDIICKICGVLEISCDEFWRRCKPMLDMGVESYREEGRESNGTDDM